MSEGFGGSSEFQDAGVSIVWGNNANGYFEQTFVNGVLTKVIQQKIKFPISNGLLITMPIEVPDDNYTIQGTLESGARVTSANNKTTTQFNVGCFIASTGVVTTSNVDLDITWLKGA